nr:hypothetical protein [Bacteroidota bacterium]
MMYPEHQRTIAAIITDDRALPDRREALLRPISDWIKEQQRGDLPADLVFICTHNSRRSLLAQVWAATAASFQGLEVKCWSAGTAQTEVAPPVITALEKAGFQFDGAGGFDDLQGYPRQD